MYRRFNALYVLIYYSNFDFMDLIIEEEISFVAFKKVELPIKHSNENIVMKRLYYNIMLIMCF